MHFFFGGPYNRKHIILSRTSGAVGPVVTQFTYLGTYVNDNTRTSVNYHPVIKIAYVFTLICKLFVLKRNDITISLLAFYFVCNVYLPLHLSAILNFKIVLFTNYSLPLKAALSSHCKIKLILRNISSHFCHRYK